jgi:hypothetical protein
VHCSVVETDQVSEVPAASIIALMMEAINTCETSVSVYKATRHIPGDIHLRGWLVT